LLDDLQIVYAEKLHILIYVKFPLRKLLLPDGVMILPVIPDRIILVKDNKTKLIVVSEINKVELEELINCILEKGIEEHGFYE
jgi:hypothetical protein